MLSWIVERPNHRDIATNQSDCTSQRPYAEFTKEWKVNLGFYHSQDARPIAQSHRIIFVHGGSCGATNDETVLSDGGYHKWRTMQCPVNPGQLTRGQLVDHLGSGEEAGAKLNALLQKS